jgi:hypothetical protein
VFDPLHPSYRVRILLAASTRLAGEELPWIGIEVSQTCLMAMRMITRLHSVPRGSAIKVLLMWRPRSRGSFLPEAHAGVSLVAQQLIGVQQPVGAGPGSRPGTSMTLPSEPMPFQALIRWPVHAGTSPPPTAPSRASPNPASRILPITTSSHLSTISIHPFIASEPPSSCG